MDKPTMARLEPVSLRSVWNHEATDFTPWLAEPENMKLLGKTIGIELELEAREIYVGPFRADMLCKDTGSGKRVVIENQLGPTDHSHLGQLLTYATGLQAETIIWIAEKFSDEHRAALDWLNLVTGKTVSFFGLEIELWRIGNSANAPKFNVVSYPNDWSRTVAESAKQQKAAAEQQLQLDFWIALKDLLQQRNSSLDIETPLSQEWIHFPIGNSQFRLAAYIKISEKRMSVYLKLSGSKANQHYSHFENEKSVIESEIGTTLDWKYTHYITLHAQGMNPCVREQWPEQHIWICEKLELFKKVFAPRIMKLNASDYTVDEQAVSPLIDADPTDIESL